MSRALLNTSRVRRGAAFKRSPIKLQTPFAAAMTTLPRTATGPPKRSVSGSSDDRFSRLASRWELVTSALARSRDEPVLHCTRVYKTRARRASTKDLSADTSHSVDDQPDLSNRASHQNGRTTTSRPPTEWPGRGGHRDVADRRKQGLGKFQRTCSRIDVGQQRCRLWVNEGGAGGEIVR
jgi:hypothetical protein